MPDKAVVTPEANPAQVTLLTDFLCWLKVDRGGAVDVVRRHWRSFGKPTTGSWKQQHCYGIVFTKWFAQRLDGQKFLTLFEILLTWTNLNFLGPKYSIFSRPNLATADSIQFKHMTAKADIFMRHFLHKFWYRTWFTSCEHSCLFPSSFWEGFSATLASNISS